MPRLRVASRAPTAIPSKRSPHGNARHLATSAALLAVIGLVALGSKSLQATTAPTDVPTPEHRAVALARPSTPPPNAVEPRDSFVGRMVAFAVDTGRIAERRAERLHRNATRPQPTSAAPSKMPEAVRTLWEILGIGAEGQILTVKDGKVAWTYPIQPGPGRVPNEYRGMTSDGRNASRGGGGSAPPESADGRLESHDHQSDAAGSVLDINAATRGTLRTDKGGTGYASYETGALLVGQASGGLQTLAIGNEGQFLSVLGGTVVWNDIPGGFSSGNVLTIADPRYVNAAGDTMTGMLVLEPSTGLAINARGTISGSLITQNGAGSNYFMGNVGVGTMSPGAKLDVQGGHIRTGNNYGIQIDRGDGSYHSIVSGANVSNELSISTSGENNTVFYSSDMTMELLKILGAGGVTIGKNGVDATGKLVIAGFDNTNDIDIAGADAAAIIDGPANRPLGILINGNDATDRFYIATSPSNTGDATTVALSVINSGNVGIGTTSPKAKLDVLGTISGSLVTQNGAGSNYFLGNVGIGSTTPGMKLDVRQTAEALPATSGTTQNGSVRLGASK